jgi:thiamine-monophosphate kinase
MWHLGQEPGRPLHWLVLATIGEQGEFGLIERIERIARRTGALRGKAVRLGLGDDAALVRPPNGEEVVVSTDAAVEGVHFRWHTQSSRTAGRRGAVAALSDLAAMGARPLGMTFALAAPPKLSLERFDGLVAGLCREAATYACPLLGGNVTRALQTSATFTVLGSVPHGKALRRRARSGDRVFATGSFGRSAFEVARAEAGFGQVRHVPTPRIRAGLALRRIPEVRGCIDVSDGFEADLAHLLGASLHLEGGGARVPAPRGFVAACRKAGFDADRLRLGGGEDYELLFSMLPGGPNASALSRRLGVSVSEIGRVRRGPPASVPAGWRHL